MKGIINFIILTGFLVIISFILGRVCLDMNKLHEALLSPSLDVLRLFLKFFVVIMCMAVSIGMIALLVRPLLMQMAAAAFGGMALLIGWNVPSWSLIFFVVYCGGIVLFCMDVAGEIKQRIKFSVRVFDGKYSVPLVVFALLVCGSIFRGYWEHINKFGFTMPQGYIDMIISQVEKPVLDQIPQEQRGQVQTLVHGELRHQFDILFEDRIKQFEKIIPFFFAAFVFMMIVTITRLAVFIPVNIIRFIILILTAAGYVKIEKKSMEVERLAVQ